MKIVRAIVSGILIWVLVFISFSLMTLVPGIKDSEIHQFLVMYVIIVPIALVGLKFYYKHGNRANGFLLGFALSATALLLDVAITLPFFVIPAGGDYKSFFINPFLSILVVELIVISFFYRKIKIS